MNWWLLVIPFIASLAGWLINGLLIKLLFHPTKPTKILGYTLQGIIPKNQPLIADKIGDMADSELFSFETIEEKISDPNNLEKLMPVVEAEIDEFLRVKLVKEMPMVGMFVGDKTISTMKTVFMNELTVLFPQLMKTYAGNLKAEIDIGKIVHDKITLFPLEKLENIIRKEMARELKLFKLIGAATGLAIGLLQVLLTLLFSR